MLFVMTSVFDHLLELVIGLAVVLGLGVVCLTVVGLCVFTAVFLAHALSRSERFYYASPVEAMPDPAYDATFRDRKVEERNWMVGEHIGEDDISHEEETRGGP